MEKFEDMWKRAVIDPLKQIRVDNGYENNFSFLEGWILHYVDDINRGMDGLGWPVVTAHPEVEEIELKGRGDRFDPMGSNSTRNFSIEAGFQIEGRKVSREDLVSRMEAGLRDLKKALASSPEAHKITVTAISWAQDEQTIKQEALYLIVQCSIRHSEKDWSKLNEQI